jgi:hypothetical protein
MEKPVNVAALTFSAVAVSIGRTRVTNDNAAIEKRGQTMSFC